MDFEFHIVGRIEAPTVDDARFHVAKAVRQMDGYRPTDTQVLFTDCGYDVRAIPHMDRVNEQASQVVFTDMISGPREVVPHPWDDDAYIFPEDHPLRDAEEFARARYLGYPHEIQSDEKDKWAELGLKELTRGNND
jgi:hypothetical protein